MVWRLRCTACCGSLLLQWLQDTGKTLVQLTVLDVDWSRCANVRACHYEQTNQAGDPHAWHRRLSAHLSCCNGSVTCRGLYSLLLLWHMTCDSVLLPLWVQDSVTGIALSAACLGYCCRGVVSHMCHGCYQCCCCWLCRVLLPLVQRVAPAAAAAVGAVSACVRPAASVHSGGIGAC